MPTPQDLYCDTCKKYTSHMPGGSPLGIHCIHCGSLYDNTKKRYIICGPEDNEEVIKAKKELLEKEPDAIIINEDVALENKFKDMSYNSPYNSPYINFIESLPLDGLGYHKHHYTYKREGKKLQRNDKCSCGSGKKYKNCCINKENESKND